MASSMRVSFFMATGLFLLAGACEPGGSEPAAVSLPVVAADDGILPCTNDLGWAVSLDEARVTLGDLEFTIEGETHAAGPSAAWVRVAQRVGGLLVPSASAHPGHQAGGEVTGALPGDFAADLIAGMDLGVAVLLAGDYHGVNFSFRQAGTADGLDPDDPLVGHTAMLSGTAAKDGATIVFSAVLDVGPGTRMVGGPFDLAVREDTGATLALTLYTVDPSENDTLFDGLDFGALDADGDGVLAIGPGEAAHNILAKMLVRHDHWGIQVRP